MIALARHLPPHLAHAVDREALVNTRRLGLENLISYGQPLLLKKNDINVAHVIDAFTCYPVSA